MTKCSKCDSTENVKHYIIADDLENPRPYCNKCWDKLQIEIIIAMDNEFNKE